MKSLRSSGTSTAALDRLQVRQRPVEERRLGQHGDRRGPGARVRRGMRRRVVVLAQNPRDGDRRLHSAMIARRRAVAQRAHEPSRARPPVGRSPFERRPRTPSALRTSTIRLAAATIVASRSDARRRCVMPAASCDSDASVSAGPRRRGRCRSPRPPSPGPPESSARAPRSAATPPALSRTMSRGAPAWPASTARAIAALSAASPPRSASGAALCRPTSAGCR